MTPHTAVELWLSGKRRGATVPTKESVVGDWTSTEGGSSKMEID